MASIKNGRITAAKSVGFKKLHQSQRGYKRKTQTLKATDVIGLIKRAKAKTAPRKRGRPTKAQERDKFAWAPNTSPFAVQGGRLRATTAPITGQSIVNLIRNPIKAPIPPPTPLSPAAVTAARANAARQRFIRGLQAEAQVFLDDGELMPSSVVEELIYDDTTSKVFVTLDGRKYTYRGVPEGVFDRWYQGQASCITDDVGGMTGRRRKRWIIGKTPSLGAFYNKYIKGRYPQSGGWV